MRVIVALAGLLVFGSFGLAGCDDAEDALTTGSSSGKGGTGTGGTGTGGTGTGGTGTGGTGTGGTGTGGTGTGGTGTGGTGTGGTGTGGTGTGGTGTGGTGTGGTGTGGTGTGGTGTGGSDSGGAGAGGESGAGAGGESGAGAGGESGAGSGGTGGTAGSSGGSIGASGSAGDGGDGGDGGAGATGGTTPPTANACGYGCVDDDDCDVANAIFCDTRLGRCKEANLGCTTHTDCVPFASAWGPETCTADADCPNHAVFGDVCVRLQGVGRCAVTPFYGDCFLAGVPTVLEHFSPTEDITVCVSSSGRCENNTCFIGCTAEPDFCTTLGSGFGPVCDSASGRCGGCTDDDQCDGDGVSRCNLATGFCECAGSGDCVGLPGRDACLDGACGCSGTSVCTAISTPAATFCE